MPTAKLVLLGALEELDVEQLIEAANREVDQTPETPRPDPDPAANQQAPAG